MAKLNLQGKTPLRVQPGVGEWGPLEVTTTRAKVRLMSSTPLMFMAAMCALFVLGGWMYLQVRSAEMLPTTIVIVTAVIVAVSAVSVLSLAFAITMWVLGNRVAKNQ